MADRPTASTVTDAQLDAPHADLERAREQLNKMNGRFNWTANEAAEAQTALESCRRQHLAAVDKGIRAEQRAERAEQQLANVRAECDAIEAEVYGQHDEDDDGMREAVRRIRGRLDGAQQPGPDGERELRPCGQPTCLPSGAHRYMLGGRIHHCPGANPSPDGERSGPV